MVLTVGGENLESPQSQEEGRKNIPLRPRGVPGLNGVWTNGSYGGKKNTA